MKQPNNGWIRLIAALAALGTLASFISDLWNGRLNWGLSY